MSKKKVLLRGVFINRDTNGEGVLKVGTTLIRVSTVMGILYTYVIIFTLIKIIVPKLLGNVKYKKDEMGRTYFSKKKISYFLFVIAVFFTVLLSFLSTIPSNVSGDAKIYLNVGIVIFCLLWYILSIMFDVWYIHLEPTQIIYRNYLGAKKVIKASDIYYFERNSNGSLIIVCSDRKGREWI